MFTFIDDPATSLVLDIVVLLLYFVAASWTQGFYSGVVGTDKRSRVAGLVWPITLLGLALYALNVRVSSRGYYAAARYNERLESWE